MLGHLVDVDEDSRTKKNPKNTHLELFCVKAVAVDLQRDQSTASFSISGTSAIGTSTCVASGWVANKGFARIFFQGLFGFLFIFA